MRAHRKRTLRSLGISRSTMSAVRIKPSTALRRMRYTSGRSRSNQRHKQTAGIHLTNPGGLSKQPEPPLFYTSPMGGRHLKIQILTIEDLLAGKGIDYPSRAQRIK